MMASKCTSDDEMNAKLLSAAVQEDIILLKKYLIETTDPSKYLNQIYRQNGEEKCTLLMIACMKKNVDMVHMLLNSFKINTELLNDVRIDVNKQDMKLYENVTVLWAATAINCFEIVKSLVEYGAKINHMTKTNSTALRCACFHGNMDIFQYLIEHGADVRIAKERNDTNLILSVYRTHIKLVQHLVDVLKCDVNECDDEGRSPLYIAVDRESLELVEFLLKRGARNFRAHFDQMSPIMLAAEKRAIVIVNLLLSYCSLIEQVEAYELLGSSFACREHGDCDLNKAFYYFSCALDLRLKHDLSKTISNSTYPIYNHRQECQTVEQLIELRSNPDSIITEALLIRERLLGSTNNRYRNSLLYRGITLVNTAQYNQGIAFCMHELELRRKSSIPIFSKQLRYFVKTFAIVIHYWLSIPINYLTELMNIVNDELKKSTTDFDFNLHSLLFLITMISQAISKSMIDDVERKMFYETVRSINQHGYITRSDGSSLLHLSLNDRTKALDTSIDRICMYPCFSTVRTLVYCGADVNAINSLWDTPLHVFATNTHGFKAMLLDFLYLAKADFYSVNVLNEMPIDLVMDSSDNSNESCSISWADFSFIGYVCGKALSIRK